MFKQKISAISGFFRKEKYFSYFILFLIIFGYFFYLQYSPTFSDPDSFYHAKMALLIRDQGVIKDFHWLKFTELGNSYIDHHFLYHLFLIPFVSFLPPLLGVKLAAVILGSLAVLAIYWFLKQAGVKCAGWWAIFLLTLDSFIFRMSLAKEPALSIAVLFLGIWLIFKRKYTALFLFSFLYVWLYAGWPLILAMVLIYVISYAIHDVFFKNYFATGEGFFRKLINNFFSLKRPIFSEVALKLVGSVGGGLITGLAVNPYFPTNLKFYYNQIVEIALINYHNIIGVGAEWYPYPLFDLVEHNIFLFIFLVISLPLFFVMLKKQDEKSIMFFIVAVLFFIMTLKSRRNIEYFIPFAVVFSAMVLGKFLEDFPLKDQWKKFKDLTYPKIFLLVLFALYVGFIFLTTTVKNSMDLNKSLKNGLNFSKYQRVSDFLVKNTPAGSVIFHNDWDDFPPLFYYDTHNDYIVGLDPTFLYRQNQDLYWTWEKITTSQIKKNLAELISTKFSSRYVLVDQDHAELARTIANEGTFNLVYADGEAKIFKIKDQLKF